VTERPEITDETDLLAAELALGFLEGEALATARHRQELDPQFALAVSQWHEVGESWCRTEADAEADAVNWQPENLWRRVEASIGASGAPIGRSAANDRGSPLRGWRTGTIAASIAAIVLIGLWLQERRDNAVLGSQIAALSGDRPLNLEMLRVAQVNRPGEGPLLTAVYDDTAGNLTVRIDTVPQGELVPELWVIGPDGRPRSLGQSSANSTIVLELSPEMRADIAAGSAIALSLEPQADAPHEQPTATTILGAASLAPLS
jgi:anti-sigma-K factor RskA